MPRKILTLLSNGSASILAISIVSLAANLAVSSAAAATNRQIVEAPEATALRSVTLLPFKGIKSSATSEKFRARLANDLTAMSFLSVSVADDSSGADGGIAIEFLGGSRAQVSLKAKSGDVLTRFFVAAGAPASDEQVKGLSKIFVDEIVRVMPYRGFLTKRLSPDAFELNLGSKQGVLKGQYFRVFEFTSPNFNSEKRDVGEVQVVDVKDDTSSVEIVSGERSITRFAKIGFPENARGMTTASYVETRGYAFIGASLISSGVSGDPKYVDAGYKITATPGFLIGGGWRKFSLRAVLAQAKSDDIDLVYSEGLANYRIYESASGLNRFIVNVGGRVSSVGVTPRTGFTTPLQSTTSVSPEVEARLERIVGGPVTAFVQGDLFYPIFVSGTNASTLIFSYGAGGMAGVSIDLSPRVFIDVGGRYHNIRRAVDGQSSIQEGFTELFANLGARF